MSLPIEVGPNPNSIATIGTIIALGDVGYLGTIGTLQAGGGGTSAYIGTIAYTGTIGTIVSGNVTASISGGVLNNAYVGTIGTILTNVAVVIGSVLGISFTSGTVSATIKASPGLLHGVVVTQEGTIGGASGTLLLINNVIGQSTEIRIVGAASDTRGFMMGVKPVTFATLIASILGTLQYSIFFE